MTLCFETQNVFSGGYTFEHSAPVASNAAYLYNWKTKDWTELNPMAEGRILPFCFMVTATTEGNFFGEKVGNIN